MIGTSDKGRVHRKNGGGRSILGDGGGGGGEGRADGAKMDAVSRGYTSPA